MNIFAVINFSGRASNYCWSLKRAPHRKSYWPAICLAIVLTIMKPTITIFHCCGVMFPCNRCPAAASVVTGSVRRANGAERFWADEQGHSPDYSSFLSIQAFVTLRDTISLNEQRALLSPPFTCSHSCPLIQFTSSKYDCYADSRHTDRTAPLLSSCN